MAGAKAKEKIFEMEREFSDGIKGIGLYTNKHIILMLNSNLDCKDTIRKELLHKIREDKNSIIIL